MDERLNRWEVLFQRALIVIDSVRKLGIPVDDWTFGGGTVLMRRHRHRLSKDIDIFINDPQFLGYLTPRLSPTAESLTTNYIEDHNYVKLVFPKAKSTLLPLRRSPRNRPMSRHCSIIEFS